MINDKRLPAPAERDTHEAEQLQSALAVTRVRDDRYLKTEDILQAFERYLGENILLAETLGHRQRQRDEAVQEIVHPLPTQRHGVSYRHSLADLKAGH